MNGPEPFGNYILLERVAIGGMAEIFRARDSNDSTQQDICIKRILPHYSEDDAFINMFIDEASIAAKLQHANIVQIYDFDTVEGCYYIAMELIDGKDLKQTLEHCQTQHTELSVEHVMVVVSALCKALGYAHSKEVAGEPLNIVHRDVSPHNVLIGFNGDVKLTDFGIAKAASRLTTTRAGTVKGKCAYMSPEQARGKTLDGRSDIFSIGILMYEMLTNRRLFTGDSDFDILTKVLKENIHPPTAHRSGIDAEAERICLKALERDRDRRYATCEEMDKDVSAWVAKHVQGDAGVGSFMARLFGRETGGLRPASSAPIPGDVAAIADMKTAMFNREEMQAPGDTPSPTHDSGDAHKPSPMTAPFEQQPRMIVPAPGGGGGLYDEKTAIRDSPFAGPSDPGDQALVKTQAIDTEALKRMGPPPEAQAPPVQPPRIEAEPGPPPPRKKRGMGLIIGVAGMLLLFLFLFVVAGAAAVLLYKKPELLGSGPTIASTDADAGTAQAKNADLRVTSKPTGAKVYLDGEFQGVTPLTVEKLQIGKVVQLKLELENHKVIEDTVTVEEEMNPLNAVFQPDDGTTPPAEADAGEAVADAGEPAKEEDAGAPAEEPDAGDKGTPTKDEPVAVAVVVPDAGAAEEPDAGDDKAVVAAVDKKEDKKVLTPEEREELRKKREEAKKRREEAARRKAEAKGTGTVTINAIPYAEVTLDGKKIGRTPVTRKVSAGVNHTVVLKNAEKKARFRTRFKVEKDKRKTVFHRFK